MSEFPCTTCGAKKRFHKKGCSELPNTLPKNVMEGIAKALDGFVLECCSRPMRRTDGANYDTMCRHNRLLTADCADCRKEHYGKLTYVCSVCGRQLQDSPNVAQGRDAFMAHNFVRTDASAEKETK